MTGKLEEIAKRTGLSEDDVRKIRSDRKKWLWIIGIAGLIASIVTFIIGLLIGLMVGESESGSSSYPYAVMGFGLISQQKMRFRRIHLPLIAIAGFLTGISRPVFGQAVDYGVYGREVL